MILVRGSSKKAENEEGEVSSLAARPGGGRVSVWWEARGPAAAGGRLRSVGPSAAHGVGAIAAWPFREG